MYKTFWKRPRPNALKIKQSRELSTPRFTQALDEGKSIIVIIVITRKITEHCIVVYLKIQFPFRDPPSFNKKFQLSNLIYDKYIIKYIKLEEKI